MLSCLYISAVCAATNPGSAIVNTATISYLDTLTGEVIEVESNTSRILVSELYQFTLNASQTLIAEPDQEVFFAHTLHNSGNVADSYKLNVDNAIADNGDLVNLQLVTDLDNNGQIDIDDPLLDNVVILQPGEQLGVLISARVPSSVVSGDTIEVVLTAISLAPSAQSEINRDEITVQEPAHLELVLTNSIECSAGVLPGDNISYRLDVINRNNALPVDREIIVDGSPRSGVLLEVILPDGMSLVNNAMFEMNGHQALALVQEVAVDANIWMSQEQWSENTQLKKLGFLLPLTHFDKDELLSLIFQLFVNESDVNTDTDIKLPVSSEIDLDADQIADVLSNSVCNTLSRPVAALPAEIRFVKPAIELQRNLEEPSIENDEDIRDARVYRLNTDKESVLNADASSDLLSDSAAQYKLVRDGVYLELVSQVATEQLLVSDDGSNYAVVNLSSRTTRDTLLVVLRETQADSGIYRSVQPVMLSEYVSGDGGWCPGSAIDADTASVSFLPSANNCVLRSVIDDTLDIKYSDINSNTELQDVAFVDPASRIVDAYSLEGIEGATVTIYTNGQPARDHISQELLIYTTDETGRYIIPPLEPGIEYYIGVDPPPTYLFPSRVPPDRYTNLNVSDVSYGIDGFNGAGNGRFVVSVDTATTIVDIPLDPANRDSLLTLEKRVLSDTVEPGESVSYQLVISNQGNSVIDSISVIDTPAFGFKLISGSVALDSNRHADPVTLRLGSDGRGQATASNDATVSKTYLFDLGNIEPGASMTLSYQLLATAAAMQGDGINSAVVTGQTNSGVEVVSALSRARVKVASTGVLSEQAIIFGKVFVDSSCDTIQNKSEWPIGGVKLYLHDGSFVVTDEDGQFSFYGMKPGLHVLKLDSLTMPEGLVLKTVDNRNAADAQSRFVELVAGDFHRADFATSCPSNDAQGVFERLEQRNRDLRGDWLIEEASRFNPDSKTRLANDQQRATVDGDLSNGLLGEPRISARGSKRHEEANNVQNTSTGAPPQLEADVMPGTPGSGVGGETDMFPATTSQNTQLSAENVQSSRMGDPKQLAATITTAQAKEGTWLWPESEFSIDGRFMAVIRAGADPVLYVNDKAIPESQIGERIGNIREQAELVAWYGVQLTPGVNNLEVRGRDGFGNERILAAAQFKRPAAGVQMLLRTRQDTLPADGGRTMLPIDIVINDANGYPANGVYFVTLESTAGDFLENDLQAIEPGVQVRIENGRGKIHLRSSDLSGRLKVSARSGTLQATLQLVQVAAARPLLGAGLIELGGRWSHRDQNDPRADLESGFDPVARAAVFLKGRVKKDMTLTLSYDSEKDNDTQLLRDLNPNEQYPTLGDASVRGFEAQSRSKLYAKLERDKHSVMWGDYLTDNRSDFDNLARVQRTLTGLNAVYDNDQHFLQFFAARQSEIRASEEVRGNGTAMLFRLSGAPLVANSEVIEIIVRDRDNLGLVLSTDRLQRFTDYSLDSFTGFLRFSEVVPSVDENLNPVFIRTSYDKQTDLDEYTVAGFRWQYAIANHASLGLSITEDQNPISGYLVSGVNFAGKLSDNTTFSASAAGIEHRVDSSTGQAQSASLEHLWAGSREHRTVMNWVRADANFVNPDSGVTAGRQEWRVEHYQPLSNSLSVTAKSLFSESTTDKTHYGSAGLSLDKRFNQWSVNAGARQVWSSDGNEDTRFNTVQLGAERRFQLPGGRPLSFGFDAERDISDSSRFRYGVNSRVQLFDHVSVYARYEREQRLVQQSLNGSQEGSQQWILGVESDVLPSTQLYSEYRMRGSYSGRNMETASGVRGRYELRPGLSLSPAMEVIDVLQGAEGSDSIAVSLGVNDSRNPNRKLSAQAEVRDSAGSRYYGFRATLAQRLNLDWTTLVREEFTRQSPETGQLTARHRFTFGLARRPKLDNRKHGLYLFNWKEDFGPEFGQDKRTYLLSTHQNFQLSKDFSISGRLGSKWQTIQLQHHDVNTRLALLDIRGIYDVNRRWELDVHGGWLGIDNGGNRYSFGAGVSWIADRNLRLGLAYNVMGFKDSDLDEQGFNQQGLQLGLQIKFDEDWFQWLDD